MAQRPKEHVRATLVAAATSSFAEVGYEATTIAGVAARAGSSIGNVYRYFQGKEELFAAALPPEFARDLRRRTRERIEALGSARDVRLLGPDARYHVLASDLLEHCIANRERVVILLGRADGTPFASFAGDFARKLVAWALAYARHAWPAARPSAAMRFALGQIYASFLGSLAQTFATFRAPEAIRAGVSHLTAHHQGGLKHLFETAARDRDAAPRSNPRSARQER